MTLVPVARAAMENAGAADVVNEVLEVFTDASVRFRLARAEVPLLPPRPGGGSRVPLTERWVGAVTGPAELTVDAADDAELKTLTGTIETWSAEIAASAGPRQLR